jgi:hypothetical protein
VEISGSVMVVGSILLEGFRVKRVLAGYNKKGFAGKR